MKERAAGVGRSENSAGMQIQMKRKRKERANSDANSMKDSEEGGGAEAKNEEVAAGNGPPRV